jgi:hypothetical protein
MAERNPTDGLQGMRESALGPAFLAARFGTPTAHRVYDRLFAGPPGTPIRSATVPPAGEVVHHPGDAEAMPGAFVADEPDHADAAHE